MIRRGVSLYSFQQSQFFGDLMLEDQLQVVGGIDGAQGIEIVDEMSLRYPDPGAAFFDHWFALMDQNGTTPVAMDVGMDVLQFRDHVMTHEECADRLRDDIRLAKRLGFTNVRVLSTTPLEVLTLALPEAEALDIRLGKEVHQPMSLEGPQVTEILEYIAKTGTCHLGIVPDLGIFQYRPSQALLGWFGRKGASEAARDAVVKLSELIRDGQMGNTFDVSLHTAGNIRSDFLRYLKSGEAPAAVRPAFDGIRDFTRDHVVDPAEVDYLVVGEALTFSNTAADTMRDLAQHITHVHAKFYEMSEVEGAPGTYEDISIDYVAAIGALRDGGFNGYVNSEYEGQRYYQDRTRADLMDEAEQVRRHQEMLARLIG